MAFQRGSVTGYRNLLAKLNDFLINRHIATAVVNAGGTGYVVGDLLSVAGGTVVNSMTARVEVLAVSGGVITSVRVFDAGAYSVNPSLTANAVTGGTGSSATIDLTMTDKHVGAVVVNAGGTGYVVGDILTVLGGTATDGRVATIEVTSVSGGVIDGVKMADAGTYSVDPSTTANAVTGGTGSSATMDLTMMLGDWQTRISNVSATVDVIEVGSGSIGAAGTGYAVSDVLTLTAAVANTSQATFTVGSIGGSGEVLGISLTTKGDYAGMVVGSVGTTVAPSGGTGCTIDPIFQPTRDEYLWEGVGTGVNEVYIGARSAYSVANDQTSWHLVGFSGYDGGSDWEAQAGRSPGNSDIDPVVNSGSGSYMLTSEGTINFWFRATERAILVIADVSGNQQSCHIGLLDPYGTNTEIPYPMFVCGTSDVATEAIGGGALWVRGPADPTTLNLSANGGPGFFRDGAVYEKVWNGRFVSGDIDNSISQDFFVYPCAQVDSAGLAADDNLALGGVREVIHWGNFIDSERDATPDVRFKPSPDSGGNLYFPIPCTVVQSAGVNKHKTMGEINGLFWVAAEDGLSAGDKITVGTRVFRVFQMGANSLSYAHFCVEEN